MTRPWLAHYPPGVPHDIDPTTYRSLAALLEESLRKNASQPVSVCMERWMSYGELDEHSASLGAWLQARGLAPGARVAIMLPNVPQFMVAMAAILRAGYTVVNVNPLYTARELEHQLKDSGAEAIVIFENFCTTLEAVIDHTPVQHVVVASMGDLLGFWYGRWISFAVRHPGQDGACLQAAPDRCPGAALGGELHPSPGRWQQARLEAQFSRSRLGGISSVHRRHHGLVQRRGADSPQCHRSHLAGRSLVPPSPGQSGRCAAGPTGLRPLPLYHIFALTLSLLTVRWGAHMTLIPNPRDVQQFVATLKRRPFHLLPAVNTLFNALLQNPQFRQLDFSSLALAQAGGMAASEATARQWLSVTGCPMVEGWGMSETCAIGTNNPVTSRHFSGTIGLPLPGIHIAIKDDDGNSLPAGTPGEICIRGPNVMTGYHNQPEETARAFTSDGFMRTGDVGIMDEQGFTHIVDRKKDMILVSGFNVFPNELEHVIGLCPGVLECAANRGCRFQAGRSRQGLCRAQRPHAQRGNRRAVLPRQPDGLQAPQVH